MIGSLSARARANLNPNLNPNPNPNPNPDPYPDPDPDPDPDPNPNPNPNPNPDPNANPNHNPNHNPNPKQGAGYHELTRVQMQAVPLLVAGREVLACAPTGSGKTAAFLVPLLTRLDKPMRQGIRAVCIAPTQELARQTHRELMKLSAGDGALMTL